MPRSPVCVDASIVVALVTPEAQSEQALSLWAEWMEGEVKVIAPTLLRCEVASALRRKVVRALMSLEDARRALETALSLDIEYLDPPQLPPMRFRPGGSPQLARRLRRPLPGPGPDVRSRILDG